MGKFTLNAVAIQSQQANTESSGVSMVQVLQLSRKV